MVPAPVEGLGPIHPPRLRPSLEDGKLAVWGPVFWWFSRQERRNISTASTRRDSLPVEGSPILDLLRERTGVL